MSSTEKADLSGNQILGDLPPEEMRRLFPNLEVVRVRSNEVLAEDGALITHCYFPLDAVITLVANLEEGRTVQVGLIGNEGMVGIRVVLGGATGAYLATVQISGRCLKIKADQVRSEFKRGGVLQDRILHYVRYLLAQVSQSAACNRMHLLEQRLCRWLLSMQDRIKSEHVMLSHEAIAQMIGATRSDVSRAVAALQEPGLLRCSRGKITIANRKGLEAASCECYWIVKRDYLYPFRAEIS